MLEPLVLITRPAGQHVAFAQRCEALGFAVSLLPCLRIRPLPVSEQLLIHRLRGCQSVVFTSANAVRVANKILPLPWRNHKVHAIGMATAKCLEQAGQHVALIPQSPYNSEAYLEQLDQLPAGSLLIIKGRAGRGLIQPHLEGRGWQVSSLDVYERVKPYIPTKTIDQLFNSHPPDIISVTSDEILNNLWHLCQHLAPVLIRIPLVVNSQRCADRAKELGFIHVPILAVPAGDTGQLTSLAHWKETLFTDSFRQ